MSYNKIVLVGNLTRDPETRSTNSGQTVCNIGIATNRKYKTAAGAAGEEVCFVDCDAWGRTGEVIAQYHRKGDAILIEGRLTFRTWEGGKDGNRRSKHSVTVERFEFLRGTGGGGGSSGGGQTATAGASASGGGATDELVGFDEVPF